jgi:hypothetical protein
MTLSNLHGWAQLAHHWKDIVVVQPTQLLFFKCRFFNLEAFKKKLNSDWSFRSLGVKYKFCNSRCILQVKTNLASLREHPNLE